MITVENKNQINNSVTMFISDDEPLYKYSAIFVKMLQQNYITGQDSQNDISNAIYSQNNIAGKRIKFYKVHHAISSYSFLNTNTAKFDFKNSLKLLSTNHRGNITFKYDITFNENLTDLSLEKYSKNMISIQSSFPKIEASIDFDNKVLLPTEEDKLTNILGKMMFFEQHYEKIKIFCHLTAFCNHDNTFKMNLREFSKLNKYISFIDQIGKPTNSARRQFLELCAILKDNKIIDNLKINMLTFNKIKQYGSDNLSTLKIKFLNFPIIHEKTFGRFNYLDHPGINFLADFLDKAGLLDIVEARISKEILTKI